MRTALADRFNARLGPKQPNGCIEWQGQLYSNGYGCVYLRKRGKHNDRGLAHRIAYSLVHGPIPEGKVVMHACDNPRCVNIEHLSLGTQLDNIADTVSKGRTRRSKLLPHLGDIYRMRSEGHTYTRIAMHYGVSRPLISLLFLGQLHTQ